jgi:hypothetical protein
MNALPVSRACDLTAQTDGPHWLIDELWAEQAVGILGGEPKCCKSFLALDIAVSVASGMPCLRQFPVRRNGPVLLYPAEDSLGVVRQRLEGICSAAGAALDALPLYVITAPRVLLDLPQDRERLRRTVADLKPVLLVLDPFIRLHRTDENVSKEVAPLLGYLRELQREYRTAVLLVHHVRKRAGKDRPGQALRGSSDLHGWGDSNLYLRRNTQHLHLTVEHRAAASPDDLALQLTDGQSGPALTVLSAPPQPESTPATPSQRILNAMARHRGPVSAQQLRKLCRIRTATLCETLAELRRRGQVNHGKSGYSLAAPKQKTVSFPSTPIGAAGNGNGKHRDQPQPKTLCQPSLFSGETQASSAGTQLAQG